MTPQKYHIFVCIMLSYIGITLECLQKNISCHNIKTTGGFNFTYDCPEGSEIDVVDNEDMKLAHYEPDKPFRPNNQVRSIDNHRVITVGCQDLQITCVILQGKSSVNEKCFHYKATEEMKNPDPNNPQKPQDYRVLTETTTIGPRVSPKPDHTIGVTIGIIGIIGIIVIIGRLYWCWKEELKREQRAATVSGFLKYIQTRFRLRDGTFRGEPGEGNRQGNGSQADDSDLRLNGVGRDENGDDIEGVLVDSTDSNVDGKTSQSLSRDHNLSDEAIQPSKNGDISALNVNKASNRRDMHRNVRDDPGGVNQGKVWMGDRHNGSTLGDRGPEDRDIEAEPLLLNGAAIQGSAGEVDLVNKLGFAPDQVSGSSPPDNDVESLTTQQEEPHTCIDII